MNWKERMFKANWKQSSVVAAWPDYCVRVQHFTKNMNSFYCALKKHNLPKSFFCFVQILKYDSSAGRNGMFNVVATKMRTVAVAYGQVYRQGTPVTKI